MPVKKVAKSSSKVEKVQKQVKPVEETISVSVVDTTGKKAGTVRVAKKIFGAEINKQLIAQAVRVYQANQRKGAASTKTRSQVSMTTAKWYRQKGTGRARHGAKSAPLFVHGGVAHGPHPKDYSLVFPQKMRKKALFSALSARFADGAVVVVSGILALEPKTKKMAGTLKNLEGKKGSQLIVTPSYSEDVRKTVRALRNIEGVTIVPANILNTYEVVKAGSIVFFKESLELLQKGV